MRKKTKSKVLKSLKKKKRDQLNIRVDADERSLIRENAKKFARGDVTKWIKYASMHLEPRPEDLE